MTSMNFEIISYFKLRVKKRDFLAEAQMFLIRY